MGTGNQKEGVFTMKKSKLFTAGVLALMLILGLVLAGCPTDGGGGNNNNNNGDGDTAVTFSSVTANGSSSQTTTQLTLTFSQAITGLSAGDITLSGVSGVNKGTLSGSGPTYTLGISGFTSGGTLNVAVAKSGYDISGSPKTAPIYYYNAGDTIVTLNSVTANGSATETTTQLELTFSQTITGLSAGDITLSGVSGVTKGIFKEIEPTNYTLDISGFTSGGILTVAVWKSGYAINGSPQTVTIYYSGSGGGDTAVTFSSVTANGSSSQTTTQLTLTFSQAITGLSAGDITLSGVSGITKGTLSGSGPTYTLGISGFTSGGTLSVAVAKSGYDITGSPKSTTIHYNSGGTGGVPTLPGSENAISLTENIWADESISQGNVQWFRFTATATQQYFYINFVTLSAGWGIQVQVYDSNGNEVGNSFNFGTTRWSNIWDVSPGDDYFVKVWDSYTGDYQIGFTKSVLRPGPRITLIINEWSDGNIATGSGDQWFKFTATATTHYIHFSPGTLTSVRVQLYDNDGNTVGSARSLTSGSTSISQTTTIDQEYQIWITPGSNNTSGNYRLGFNTSNVGPGISWVQIDSGYFRPNAVAYGGGRFVAVSNVSQAAYSTNGVSWTTASMGNTSTTYIDIAYSTDSSDNNKFVAVSNSGLMSISSDGTSWTSVGTTTFGSSRINGIAFGVGSFGSRFVAVGESGKLAYAANTSYTFEFIAATNTFGTSTIYDVAYGSERFVAVGQGGKAAYSSDGVTWYTISDSGFGTSDIYGITYGSGKFVAVGQGGKAAYSTDGVNWTAVSNTTFGSTGIEDIAYGGGKFVAVGQAGKAAYSSDGIAWNIVDVTTYSSGSAIYAVTYGGGRFVVAGDGGMAYWITP